VAGLAVLAALNSYSKASKLAAEQPDPYGASSAHDRFAPALSQIPKDAPLGDISDLGLEHKAGVTAFWAAQYALAPHAVAPVDPAAPT